MPRPGITTDTFPLAYKLDDSSRKFVKAVTALRISPAAENVAAAACVATGLAVLALDFVTSLGLSATDLLRAGSSELDADALRSLVLNKVKEGQTNVSSNR